MITEKTSSISSYVTAAGVATTGGITFNEWMMLGGFILGVATLAINWYYKQKTYKLMERKHDDTIR